MLFLLFFPILTSLFLLTVGVAGYCCMYTLGRTSLHDGSARLCYLICVIYKQTQQGTISLGKVVIVNGIRAENPRNYGSFI